MPDIYPLLLHRAPKDMLPVLKKAKDMAIGDQFFVQPREVSPGDEGVFLAFEWPNWCPIQGFADVRRADTPERLAKALRQAYGLDEPVNITQPAVWLSRTLGAEVKEVVDDGTYC